MSSIRNYQVDHLLLLIGSNLLPNVVAGKLLVAEGGMITLIHSEDTAPLAERLGVWLKTARDSETPVARIEFAEVKESDADSIYRRVEQVLKDYESKTKQTGRACVGLHYTGGTKVMSVHAYRALEKWAKDHHQEALFSYLDAHTLCMRIESSSNSNPLSFPVGLEVEISRDELVNMHGWEWLKGKQPVTEPLLPESAAALLAIHSNPDGAKIWAEWLSRTLHPSARKRKRITSPLWYSPSGQEVQDDIEQASKDWKSPAQLRELAIPWPDQSNLRETMKKELGQNGVANLKLTAGKDSGWCKSEEDFCQWLNGTWLEAAVLSALQNCPEDLYLKDCCMSLHLTPGKDRGEFEFDVVARRGYQLFAFSCTTDSGMGLLKQKLFEVYIRARQMGGEEACAALVCCLEPDKVDKLEREVRHDIGPEVRIRVFGRDQLENLSRNLEEWIREQSKEG